MTPLMKTWRTGVLWLKKLPGLSQMKKMKGWVTQTKHYTKADIHAMVKHIVRTPNWSQLNVADQWTGLTNPVSTFIHYRTGILYFLSEQAQAGVPEEVLLT